MWNFTTTLDMVSLFAFFLIAVFAYLAPRLGYTTKPDMFFTSLYLLVAALGLIVISTYLMRERDFYNETGTPPMVSVLLWLKAALEIAALLLLIRDLRSLRPASNADGEANTVEPDPAAAEAATEPIKPQ